MIEIEQAPFFDAFSEPAELHLESGIKTAQIIADFDIVIEGEYAVGFDGVFDLLKPDYFEIKAGNTIKLNGKTYTVIQKAPIKNGIYQVLVQS